MSCQIEVVASHDHRISGQGLLNRSLLIHQLFNINAHFSLKHPSLCEIKALCSIKILHHQVQLALSQARHGETPLNGGGEFNGEDAVLNVHLATAGDKQEAFVQGRACVVKGGVLHTQVPIVAQLNSNFVEVIQSVGVRNRNPPANLLGRLETHEGVIEEVGCGSEVHQCPFGGRSRLPSSVPVCSGGRRNGIPCQIGPFKQHATPLVVVVDGVVDGDVHRPPVSFLVAVEQGLLVFFSLWHTVTCAAVGAVIASLEPGVSGQGLV